MHIIYIVNEFPTNSEVFVFNEIRSLHEMGLDISFYPLRRNKIGEFGSDLIHLCLEEPKGILVNLYYLIVVLLTHPLLLITNFRCFFEDGFRPRDFAGQLLSLAHACRLISIIQKRFTDNNIILHAHFAGRTAETAWYANELGGLTYSVTVHATDIYTAKNLIRIRRRLNRAKHIVSISEFARNFLIQQNLVPLTIPIDVIHCGVDTKKVFPRNIASPSNQEKIILSVGRAVEKKGYHDLLEAFKLVESKFPEARLVIIGDGPKLPGLQQKAKNFGIDEKVDFLGFVTNLEVQEWYQKADLFILSCIKGVDGDMDGIPYVLMEAMATGVPVISTSISGIPELIVNEQNGILVPPHDPNKLASVMEELISDVGLARRLSIAGRQTVEDNFNLHFQAMKMADFFINWFDE